MKADKNDAPEWIKSSHSRRGNMGAVIPGLIGTVITIGALYMASQAFLQVTVKNLVESKQQPKPAPVAEIRRAEPQTDWNRVVEEQARRDATSQPKAEKPGRTANTANKQTVFNDLNYKPQGAINIVPAEQFQARDTSEKTNKKLKVTVIKETKDTTCGAFREGSLERRNCKAYKGLNYRK